MTFSEHQAYRFTSVNGRTGDAWARRDADAIRKGKKWAARYGGLLRVQHLTPVDALEGCWDRAIIRSVYA